MSGQLQLGTANFGKDSYIAVEGRQRADSFFIVRQGTVKIMRKIAVKSDGEELLVAGDIFGVAPAMSSLSHIESAVAVTDVTLIVIRPQQYPALIQRNPQIAVKILDQLSVRLRLLDSALAGLAQRNGANPAEDGPPRLFDVGEYYFRQKQYGRAFYAYNSYLKYCPEKKHLAAASKRLDELAGTAGDPKVGLNRIYRKGDTLFAEGEPGDELLVIQSGSVKVSKVAENREVPVAVLKTGDVLGEMALLEAKPQALSAVAAEDCAVMAVGKANLDSVLREHPQVVSKITTVLAGKVWFAFRRLENTLAATPLGRVYGLLHIHLEKARVNLESTSVHIFNFRWEDLVEMLWITEKEGYILMGELQEDKNIQVRKGIIHVDSIRELVRMCEYHRKMDRIAKSLS